MLPSVETRSVFPNLGPLASMATALSTVAQPLPHDNHCYPRKCQTVEIFACIRILNLRLLFQELERGRGPYHGSGQFSYSNWSPPAQSNETANGYFLERSHSARLTLQKACELLPEEVSLRLYT